jgi:hypothetical protein
MITYTILSATDPTLVNIVFTREGSYNIMDTFSIRDTTFVIDNIIKIDDARMILASTNFQVTIERIM